MNMNNVILNDVIAIKKPILLNTLETARIVN